LSLIHAPPKTFKEMKKFSHSLEQEKADQRLDQLGLFGGEGRFERLQN
jgi:hypothetical protein